jgi:hypothetical protein
MCLKRQKSSIKSSSTINSISISTPPIPNTINRTMPQPNMFDVKYVELRNIINKNTSTNSGSDDSYTYPYYNSFNDVNNTSNKHKNHHNNHDYSGYYNNHNNSNHINHHNSSHDNSSFSHDHSSSSSHDYSSSHDTSSYDSGSHH